VDGLRTLQSWISGIRAGRGLLGAVILLESLIVISVLSPAPHPGGDEAIYVSLAKALLTTGSYVESFDPAGLPHAKYPPVYPLLLALWISCGARSWLALKTTAAASTVAATALTFLWAERKLSRYGAFAIALLFGSSAAVLYYSHWALSDPTFVAWTMLALWALDRDAEVSPKWLAIGLCATSFAYLTRGAGLPLVLATGVWLARRRQLRALGAAVVIVGLPALAWWAREQGAAGAYASEFWQLDPYDPSREAIGMLDLIRRVFANLSGYVFTHVPRGVVGGAGSWTAALGVLLTLAALYGFWLSARRRIGLAEFFFPLYAGTLLLWPAVWSGDRFVLPLYPLIFVYGAVALRELRARLPEPAAKVALCSALIALLMPAAVHWSRERRDASACSEIAASHGPWACYSPRVNAFITAAKWAGSALPEGSSVLSRKPGIFYAASGVPSRAFPFSQDPDAHLALADELGTRYVLLDAWDALANRYVGQAVARRPGAFCFVREFGDPQHGGAQLLGILPQAMRSRSESASGRDVDIEPCPADYVALVEPVPSSLGTDIAILAAAHGDGRSSSGAQ
jgi:hypothetical protein